MKKEKLKEKEKQNTEKKKSFSTCNWRRRYNWKQEKGNHQVHDDTFYGDLSGSTATPEKRPDSYPQDADSESKKFVFDMSVNDTLEYGGYYWHHRKHIPI